ncbi:uncharacterized protein BYT42DRAFT_498970 [Radiomyces spectabilis]|uniref:uncharacterized protein n=1 Tax=Radiomyces spectabilis TaxID=64574 RepID=UPI00221EC87A|nr:uncharacterized protein BYT42DRAFT_498970 [Radiomyces spectabilis]KAI8375948.1 hypothetical protein BYT42DRAFT_498970 [Radiomyces spectabilis]
MEWSTICSLCSLIRKLPPLPIEEDVNESELCSRFVEPFLSGLFDDQDAGVYLRWTNETRLETKKYGHQDGLSPDLCITGCYSVKWNPTFGYDEAKAVIQAEDHHSVCCYLLKLAVFCKNALDNQNFDGIMGIQIVGRPIPFYVLLPAMRLYIKLKLAEIKLPDSFQGIASLVTELPYAISVLEAFHNCARLQRTPNAPSITTPYASDKMSSCKATVPRLALLFATAQNCSIGFSSGE